MQVEQLADFRKYENGLDIDPGIPGFMNVKK